MIEREVLYSDKSKAERIAQDLQSDEKEWEFRVVERGKFFAIDVYDENKALIQKNFSF